MSKNQLFSDFSAFFTILQIGSASKRSFSGVRAPMSMILVPKVAHAFEGFARKVFSIFDKSAQFPRPCTFLVRKCAVGLQF